MLSLKHICIFLFYMLLVIMSSSEINAQTLETGYEEDAAIDSVLCITTGDFPRQLLGKAVMMGDAPTIVIQPRSMTEPHCSIEPAKQSFLAVKTNLLYDLALTPNVGVEVALGKGWTLGAGWNYAWWRHEPSYLYWRIYGGELTARKYFGKQSEEKSFAGHHGGIYGQAYTYDISTGKKGQISNFTYGGGIEYGYTLHISENLAFDFSLGLGFLTGEYKVYIPDDGCYVWRETRQRYYIGPTKAEVSLVWMLYSRKGGKL